MTNCTRYVGLDVHAETITVAIAEGRGESARGESARGFLLGLGPCAPWPRGTPKTGQSWTPENRPD
jgi:hypothetical protein